MRIAHIGKFNNQQMGVICNSLRILINTRVSGVTGRVLKLTKKSRMANIHHKNLLLHTNILHADYRLQSPNDTPCHEQLKTRT